MSHQPHYIIDISFAFIRNREFYNPKKVFLCSDETRKPEKLLQKILRLLSKELLPKKRFFSRLFEAKIDSFWYNKRIKSKELNNRFDWVFLAKRSWKKKSNRPKKLRKEKLLDLDLRGKKMELRKIHSRGSVWHGAKICALSSFTGPEVFRPVRHGANWQI